MKVLFDLFKALWPVCAELLLKRISSKILLFVKIHNWARNDVINELDIITDSKELKILSV